MNAKETLKIYHKGDTSKISKIEALIEGSYYETLSLNLLKDKLTATRLLQLGNKLKKDLKDLVDQESNLFKDSIANSDFDEADWLRILTKHPQLIKTPIIEFDNEAFIVDSPREVLKFQEVKQNINGYNHI